ncbi:MAG: MarR family transcriptional regulator, partial [Candidatus Diapherotrites archaeon]
TTKSKEIELSLENAKINYIKDIKDNLNFKTEKEKIIFYPNEQTKNYSLTINYQTDNLTEKKENKWNFKYSKESEYELLGLKVALPKNAKIITTTKGAMIYAEEKEIIVEWDNNEKEYFIEYQYMHEDKNDTWIVSMTLALTLITLASILIIYFLKQKSETPQKKQITEIEKEIIKVLPETEAKIIKHLKERKEPITQKRLQAELMIPKSTLSRTLAKLEVKGLIQTSEIGNTKLIQIKQPKT